MSDDTRLMTAPEAAKLLRISRNLGYELVARGEIPAIRLGRVLGPIWRTSDRREPLRCWPEWGEAQLLGFATGAIPLTGGAQ